MKQIFIDKFIVPQNALEEFTNRMNYNRKLIKNMPGFIKDTAYKQINDNGNVVIITIAEWKDVESLNNAKEVVQEDYKKNGFNPSEMMTRLNITMERGVYSEVAD